MTVVLSSSIEATAEEVSVDSCHCRVLDILLSHLFSFYEPVLRSIGRSDVTVLPKHPQPGFPSSIKTSYIYR